VNRQRLVEFFVITDFEKEATDALLSDFDILIATEGVSESLERVLAEYVKSFEPSLEEFEKEARFAAEASGVNYYSVALLYLISMGTYSLPAFLKAGVGEEEWVNTMCDFRWKCAECKKVYGVYGTFVASWYMNILSAKVIAFGRLQFNLFASDSDYISDNFEVNKGDTLVAVHIPSDVRCPFSRENREAAYKRAAKYFAPHFKDGVVIFRCGSWLLNPAHREILPEGSNIRDFLNDFELDYSSYRESNNDIWRFFYVADYNGDPDTLPEDTSLMRTYKRFLQSGGKLATMRGYRKA